MSEVSPIDSLLADFRLSQKRLAKIVFTTPDDARKELMQNVYPSLEAMAEQMAEIDTIVGELSSSNFLDEELAGQIFQTLAAGAALVIATRSVFPALDDLTRKRLEEVITTFEHSAEVTISAVTEAAALEESDEDEDEDDEDDEDEENEEDETDEQQKEDQ